MLAKKPQSQFVRLVMPSASEAEIEDATRRWFGFLQTLDRIVTRLEQENGERDSRDERVGASLDSNPSKL